MIFWHVFDDTPPHAGGVLFDNRYGFTPFAPDSKPAFASNGMKPGTTLFYPNDGDRFAYSGFGPTVIWTKSAGRSHLANASLTCSAVISR
jgi:hypothetical protein